MIKSETQLDPDDVWDTLEYAPLSDIGSTQYETRRNFIVKMVEEGAFVDDNVPVKFIDEEGEQKTILVHEDYKGILVVDRVFVIHRVKLLGSEASVDNYGMLVPAPSSYVW